MAAGTFGAKVAVHVTAANDPIFANGFDEQDAGLHVAAKAVSTAVNEPASNS